MKISPLGDRILVKRLPEKSTTKGGIHVPENAQEKPQEGIVVAVGPGRLTDSCQLIGSSVVEGQHVLFGKFAGVEIQIDGEEHLILREDDILALVA